MDRAVRARPPGAGAGRLLTLLALTLADLRVINNVAFETMGNTYFVEDGIETKNIITHNLGANTRQSFAGLTVDQTPATCAASGGSNRPPPTTAAFVFTAHRSPPCAHPPRSLVRKPGQLRSVQHRGRLVAL